jgi:hypothetical protein
MGRLDVFVDQALPMELAKRRRQADGQAQKLGQCHGASQPSIERLAARVGEDERLPPVVEGERERAHGPRGIELGP